MDSVRDNELQSLEMVYDGITYLYQLNLQGDVIALLNSSGGYVATYVYDAWGKVLSVGGSNTTIANANPLRYRGYYYDTDTELYYLGSRYYDPVVKRFINADIYASTAQGFIGYNSFAYSLNNPVSIKDDNGTLAVMATKFIVCGVASAISGAIWGGISAAASGGSTTDVLRGVASGCIGGAISGVMSAYSTPFAIIGGVVGSVISYTMSADSPTAKGILVSGVIGAIGGIVSSPMSYEDVGLAGIATASYVIGGATGVLSTIGTTITDSCSPEPKRPSISSSPSKPNSPNKTITKPNQKNPAMYVSKDPAARIPMVA